MFENALLIIKPDYIHKRRPVLLKLLAEDFQIQTNRRVQFSPELAAEFFCETSEKKNFMLKVILLSKGVSEAFILTKENAVQELRNILICYFGSSDEMERFVYVSKDEKDVAREINFIFPNYIHEPIDFFNRGLFCNRPMLKPLIAEIYDILQNADCSEESWKVRVADYLARSNATLPQISNQCSRQVDVNLLEKSQQTKMTYPSPGKAAQAQTHKSIPSSSSMSSTSPHSSMLLSSSSCVTCGGFERSEPCISELDLNKRREPQDDEQVCVEEEIIWKEVIMYEEEQPEEEAKDFLIIGEQESDGSEDVMAAGSSSESVHSEKNAPPAAPPPTPPTELVSEDEAEEVEKAAAATEEAPAAPEEAPAAPEEAPAAPEEAPPPAEEAPPPAEPAPPAEDDKLTEDAPPSDVPTEDAPTSEAPPEEEAPPAERAPAEE